jgi:hypothetical protein
MTAGGDHPDLVALHRSTAMLPPGTGVTMPREALLAVLEDLFATRALLSRLSADLHDVHRHGQH